MKIGFTENVVSGNVAKAKTLIKNLKVKRDKVTGDSLRSWMARDTFNRYIDRLESASELCNGYLPERNNHWRSKLSEYIDEAVMFLHLLRDKENPDKVHTPPDVPYTDSGYDDDEY